MRAREVSGRVDHGHYREPEGSGDTDRAELASSLGIDDDRAAAGEDESESRERLGEAASRE